MSSVVVFGGYGTFGSIVARELARCGIAVVVAGRRREAAEAFARRLGPAQAGLAADVTDAGSCRAALRGCDVAVNCAGPFSVLGRTLLEACLDAGCHYVDITDDRIHAALVREYDERFRVRGLTAAYGCSSLPSISGALACIAADGAVAKPERVRVALFIGNDHPKGRAAIASLVASLGKPIRAPQGTLRVFGDREVVPLPPPLGRRSVYNFESPDYDLLPLRLGVRAVSVKLGFELRPVNAIFAVLAARSSNYGARTAAILVHLGRWVRGFGTLSGAVMTELFFSDGSVRWAALVSLNDGQRMAALPCAIAAGALAAKTVHVPGAVTADEMLGARTLIERLTAAGCQLWTSHSFQAP